MIKYVAEFVGTFVFLSIILSKGEPIAIAVGLLAAIYFLGAVSGGHFNPAVSTMMFLKGTLPSQELGGYVLAQLAGAAAALYFNKYMTSRIAF